MEHEPLNSDAQARIVEHIIDAIDSRLTNYPNAKAIDKAHQNRMIKSALNKHPSRYTYPGCKQKNGVPYGTDSVRLLLKQIVRDHQLSSNYDISDKGLNALFENGSDFITDAFWKVLCQAHLIKGVQPTSDWQGVSNIDKDADNLLDASSEKRLDGSKSNDHIDDEEALYHQPPAVIKDSGKTKSDGHNGAERPPVTTQRTLRQPASAAGTRKTIDLTGVRKTSKAESVGTRSNIRSNSMAATPVFNHLYDKPLNSGQVSSTSNAGRKRGSLRISDDDDTIYVNHPEHANPQQGPIKKAKVPSSTKTQNASGEESNALIALDQGAAQTIAMTGETLHNGPVIIRSGTKRVNSAPGINEPPTKKAKINPLPPPLVASSQSSSAFSKKSGKQLAPAKLAPSRTRQPASERLLLGQGEAQMDGDLDLSTGRETHQGDLVDDFMSDAGS
ncbi:unnamed protein product [Zymoseptoria tritici ST99CH_3D1]|nr:unnamed protein product [Zymoseptoria tritici ST99CH_3D1]